MAGEWLKRDITVPANDEEREAVRTAQRALRIEETGELDWLTRTRLRGLQLLFNLPRTGILDRASAQALDALRPPSLRGD